MTVRSILSHGVQKTFALVCLLYALVVLKDFPTANFALAIILGVYALFLVLFSCSWLLVLPALLPVLDLTPWSGKELVSEFDLIILLTLAIGYGGGRCDFKFIAQSKKLVFALLLLCGVEIYSLIIGFNSLEFQGVGAFFHYHSQQTSLRMSKGFFEALLLLPLLCYEFNTRKYAKRVLAIGVLTGLSFCIISIFLERIFYAGVADFLQDYRVSGMFSEMALGGAFLDAFLILSFPFVFLLLRRDDNPAFLISGFILAVLGLYCALVTFTRTTYLAVFVMAAMIIVFNIKRARVTLDKLGFYVILGGMVLAILLPVVGGGFLKQRFGTVSADLTHRFEHWNQAINIMDDDISTKVFGMGRGTFPFQYHDRTLDGAVMSRFWLNTEQGASYLRFSRSGSDGTLFIKQRLQSLVAGEYRLEVTMRTSSKDGDKLLVEFCERNILKAKPECPWLGLKIGGDSLNQWITVSKKISLDHHLKGDFANIKPIEISIMNRGVKDYLDIQRVNLIAPDGSQILANPDFSAGFDHWMFSSGNHLAWHIKNMWVSAYFESGIFGLVVLVIYLLVIWIVFYRRAVRGDPYAMALVASVSGLILLGLFASVFDDPRISLLLFLCSWLALIDANKHDGAQQQPDESVKSTTLAESE